MKKKLMFSALYVFVFYSNLIGQNTLAKSMEKDSIEAVIHTINFESYYNGTIDSLFMAYPILNKYADYIFFTEPANCLDRLALKFQSNNSVLVVEIYPKKLMYLEPCKKDIIWWDLEIFKKEGLRKVVIW